MVRLFPGGGREAETGICMFKLTHRDRDWQVLSSRDRMKERIKRRALGEDGK